MPACKRYGVKFCSVKKNCTDVEEYLNIIIIFDVLNVLYKQIIFELFRKGWSSTGNRTRVPRLHAECHTSRYLHLHHNICIWKKQCFTTLVYGVHLFLHRFKFTSQCMSISAGDVMKFFISFCFSLSFYKFHFSLH